MKHWNKITFLSLLLFPLSLVFRLASSSRRFLYRSKILKSSRLPVPVIVVGNLTVGGTGKSPLVGHLAGKLREKGFHPGIISRGYGGDAKGPMEVTPDGDPSKVGDEPLMLSRKGFPLWVGEKRADAARALLQQNPRCDILISDDGLQHYALDRDVEIVVVDGEKKFGNGLLLPAGPLREPVSRLEKADALVVNGQTFPCAKAKKIFPMALSGSEFRNVKNPQMTAGADDFKDKKIHAVAGIGNPERFFQSLENLGIKSTNHAFADHHPFSFSDIDFGESIVLMTEKDAVKCEKFAGGNCWFLPVVPETDESLVNLIIERIRIGQKAA